MAPKWFQGKPADEGEWAGFIDRGVTMEGKLIVSGTFRVEGQFKGNIVSENSLVIGEGGHAEGQIDANEVTIAGRFEGQIFAKQRVEIQPKGVACGEIHTPCLVIQPGGILDGHCHMLSPSEPAKPIAIPIRSGSPN